MGATILEHETYALGNHKGVKVRMAFEGLYPAGGYACSCDAVGLTEVAGMVAIDGQDGVEFSHEPGRLRAFMHGAEAQGMQLDGMVVTFLFLGH